MENTALRNTVKTCASIASYQQCPAFWTMSISWTLTPTLPGTLLLYCTFLWPYDSSRCWWTSWRHSWSKLGTLQAPFCWVCRCLGGWCRPSYLKGDCNCSGHSSHSCYLGYMSIGEYNNCYLTFLTLYSEGTDLNLQGKCSFFTVKLIKTRWITEIIEKKLM